MLNAKTLKKLAIITTVCVVPLVVLVLKNGGSSIRNKNELLLPDLLNKKDQITKVIIQDQKKTLTLNKNGNVWHLAERNNYPVLNDKVDEFLYSLADLRVIEPKTNNHEFYKQLDVNDISEPGSEALLITVNDLYNDILAKVYIGKREGVRLGEEYQEHIFVRKSGDDQTWLVQGIMSLTNDFRDWVEQPLIGIIESDQIKKVEIDRPSADKIIISKAILEQEDFNLQDLQVKEGMVADLDAINTVPFEIAEMEFVDVQLANEKTDWNNSLTATLETFPGVKVVLTMIKDGAKVLAKVNAHAIDDASKELQEKVLSFNSAKKNWVYEISPEIYKELALAKSDFLKPKEVE